MLFTFNRVDDTSSIAIALVLPSIIMLSVNNSSSRFTGRNTHVFRLSHSSMVESSAQLFYAKGCLPFLKFGKSGMGPKHPILKVLTEGLRVFLLEFFTARIWGGVFSCLPPTIASQGYLSHPCVSIVAHPSF